MDYKSRFIEQFEDSEQYFSGEAAGPSMLNNAEDGYPVQLIRVRPSGKV